MTTAAKSTTDFHEEDVELIEKLAKLQEMHQQIFELRNLLPTKLLAPARDAINKKLSPVNLARAISNAAQNGRHDIRNFRDNWHDEKTRDVFQKASAADIPQGADAWKVDYLQLAGSRSAPALSTGSAPSSESQNLDEVFAKFRESHKNVAIDFPLEPNKLPIHASLGGMRFSIEDSSGSLLMKVLEDSSDKGLAKQIADQIRASTSANQLNSMLDTLEAYHDIKSRPCHNCGQIYDEDIELPIMRRRVPSSGSVEQNSAWQAFHVGCS